MLGFGVVELTWASCINRMVQMVDAGESQKTWDPMVFFFRGTIMVMF